mmetsp:Transcript_10552/g.30082  ORF Transcript_10552/g.30082 Transcript_10552/m.30082 type:complete len:222 (-) Transcript_10552:137-802(-)
MTAILSSFSRESVSSWHFKAAISDLSSAIVDGDDKDSFVCAAFVVSPSLPVSSFFLNGVALPLLPFFGVPLALSGSSFVVFFFFFVVVVVVVLLLLLSVLSVLVLFDEFTFSSLNSLNFLSNSIVFLDSSTKAFSATSLASFTNRKSSALFSYALFSCFKSTFSSLTSLNFCNASSRSFLQCLKSSNSNLVCNNCSSNFSIFSVFTSSLFCNLNKSFFSFA